MSYWARTTARGASVLLAVVLVICGAPARAMTLRIAEQGSGAVIAEREVAPGDSFFFGWIHSWEKIPWNEYYHITDDGALVLDAITFPAFGAGIPEDKGRVCYVDSSGLIHMEQIDQRFEELVWINSHTAVTDLKVGGAVLARGPDMPDHVRLRLYIERSIADGSR